MTGSPARFPSLAIALLLATAGLAGCVGQLDDSSSMTFEEAQTRAHTTAKPQGASTLMMGLIDPVSTEDVAQGKRNVTIVLWDEGTGEPVTGAEITMDARMPAMGHGTSPEEDPTHTANGVYEGMTNFMMGGEWILKFEITRETGSIANFEVPVQVVGGGGMDHDDSTNGSTSSSPYGSYQDAKDAEGPTVEPAEDSPYRLKLLEPSETENLDTGSQNVTILVYDSQADEPVTNGSAFLNATMPAMGHGTSPETDPIHAEHGVWQGSTTFGMNGTWVLNIDLKPEGASWLAFDVNVTVGSGSMQMDKGPAFDPYTRNYHDNVTSENYTKAYDLEVKAADATVTLNGSLANATPEVDNLTVSLVSPNGTELESFELKRSTLEALNEENATGQLVVDEAPVEGNYRIHVTGSALQTSYHLTAHVSPP